MNLSKYGSLIFDCDGVVLKSNDVKTNSFYSVCLPYGKQSAEELVNFHILNGGISRYVKFKYYLNSILPKYLPLDKLPPIDNLLREYSSHTYIGLLKCEMAEGLFELRNLTKEANWLIVSGGDQEELREVFKERKIYNLFDGGIFGSPEDKKTILKREIKNHNIKEISLFLGDSKFDHIAASYADIDFLFISQWTEFTGYRDYCINNKIKAIKHIKDLL